MTEAVRARQTVAALMRSGRIVRTPCEMCGAERVEAHHPFGYEGPNALRISWLCAHHHRLAHKETDHAEARSSTAGMTLVEAATKIGTTPDNLRGAIKRGSLKAKKLGRDWIVTPAEVERYGRENRRLRER